MIIIDIAEYHLDAPLTKEGFEYAQKWLKDIGEHILSRDGKEDE